MRFPFGRWACLLTVLLIACACSLGSVWGAAPPLPSGRLSGTHAGAEAPPAPPASVTIPGPLRSFLRMAALSQKISPNEFLPLLARHVAVMGYRGSSKHLHPTEYLLLLEAYVKQARELRALAGSEGVIRVANCSEAEPLLKALGYQLAEPCGPTTFVKTADPERAFLTVDSGFPLTALEETLHTGKPFEYSFPSSPVPVLFSPNDWTKIDRNQNDDVLDALLRNPRLARLYWALAQIDEHTRRSLRQSPGLEQLLPLAPVLDFYGNHILIRSGRVVVPGGTGAESAWKDLVGGSPDSPGEFVIRLLAKDEGWLAAYFDALSRISSERQRYFTDAHRLRRFYEALRGRDVSPGAARHLFRFNPGLLLLMTRLQFEPTSQPHVPGNLEVWRGILAQKSYSKMVEARAKDARHCNTPDQLVEAMIGLSRVPTGIRPLDLFLTLSEIDRRRSPQHRLSPQTVRLLAEEFPRFGNQYIVFTEFDGLSDDSIARYLDVAEAIDRIPDRLRRGDARGLFQANLGLWQILARQGQIPAANWNESWQRVIEPFASIGSSAQLFDAARSSLGELLQASAGRSQFSQDEIIALLAGPKQTTPEGERVRQELANKMRSILDAQRLFPLDPLFKLGDGLNQMAEGKVQAESLLPLAGELEAFEMPKPLFTSGERAEWAFGLYNRPHTQAQLKTNLVEIIKSPVPSDALAAARGQLVPFLRDTLVGLNYAYYVPPGAQMMYNNALFVRSHDFSGDASMGVDHSWEIPQVYGGGNAAGGGAHLVGSLADLPYVLAKVEQNFIAPQHVQALIWEDLVPTFMTSAVIPRWWQVTQNQLHAVALYQRHGEELLTAAGKNEELRQKVMEILSERMLPEMAEQVEQALRVGRSEAALSQLAPAEAFHLAAEFRRRFPREVRHWGKTGQELDVLVQQHPQEVSLEQLSEHFGAPHPALAGTYARELLGVKPFPTFMGYSSRLMAESWDSNTLYWARLADEKGYPPVMLNILVPELTHLMVEKISATHLEDWPALLRAMRETGMEFQEGRVASAPGRDTTSAPSGLSSAGAEF